MSQMYLQAGSILETDMQIIHWCHTGKYFGSWIITPLCHTGDCFWKLTCKKYTGVILESVLEISMEHTSVVMEMTRAAGTKVSGWIQFSQHILPVKQVNFQNTSKLNTLVSTWKVFWKLACNPSVSQWKVTGAVAAAKVCGSIQFSLRTLPVKNVTKAMNWANCVLGYCMKCHTTATSSKSDELGRLCVRLLHEAPHYCHL